MLAACSAAGAAVVPQGGNTGLVGGGVPRGGEVVLSLARLTAIGPLDAAARQVTVGAGVTPAALAAALRGTGLALGVDLARPRRGDDRRHGRDGRGRRAGAAPRDDARAGRGAGGGAGRRARAAAALRAGEGQRGLRPAGAARRLRGDAGRDHRGAAGARRGAGAARHGAARRGLDGEAVELVARARGRAARALRRGGLRRRRAWRSCASTSRSPIRSRPSTRSTCCSRPPTSVGGAGGGRSATPDDVAVADDTARREALWRYREALNPAVNAAGVPHKLDVSVPIGAMAAFAAAARGGGRGARRAGDPLGPPRGREPARQRARARAGRRARGRGRARAGGRARRLDQRGARRGGRQAALPRPHPHPGGGGGDGGREARARPGRGVEPRRACSEPQSGISPSPVNSCAASSNERSGGGRITSDSSSSSSPSRYAVGADELEHLGEDRVEARLVAGVDRLDRVVVERVEALGVLVREAVLVLGRDPDDHCWPPGCDDCCSCSRARPGRARAPGRSEPWPSSALSLARSSSTWLELVELVRAGGRCRPGPR